MNDMIARCNSNLLIHHPLHQPFGPCLYMPVDFPKTKLPLQPPQIRSISCPIQYSLVQTQTASPGNSRPWSTPALVCWPRAEVGEGPAEAGFSSPVSDGCLSLQPASCHSASSLLVLLSPSQKTACNSIACTAGEMGTLLSKCNPSGGSEEVLVSFRTLG